MAMPLLVEAARKWAAAEATTAPWEALRVVAMPRRLEELGSGPRQGRKEGEAFGPVPH